VSGGAATGYGGRVPRIPSPILPLVALAGLAGTAGAAPADVAVLTEEDAGPVLRIDRPSGGSRAIPLPAAAVAAGPPVVSPDRTLVGFARNDGRVVLVPLDGGPTRTVGRRLTRATTPLPSLTWSAGRVTSSLSTGVSAGREQSCDPSGSCTSRRTRAAIAGVLPDGRRVRLRGPDVSATGPLVDAWDGWLVRSPARVRVARRALARVERGAVLLEELDGRTRTIARIRGSLLRGISLPLGSPYPASPHGLALSVLHLRLRLEQRRRAGRTETRIVDRTTVDRTWRVAPDGRIVRLPWRGFLAPSPTPDGWIGADPRERLVAVPAAGDATVLRVGGRPATPATVLAAAGLERPLGGRLTFEIAGLEPATDSVVLVVSAAEGASSPVLRVPRDGAAPTVVPGTRGVLRGGAVW
jgi:hypothetical protein